MDAYESLIGVVGQRLQLWEILSKLCYEKVGSQSATAYLGKQSEEPSRFPPAQADLVSATAYSGERPEAGGTSIKDLVHKVPPGIEYQQDGSQTTVIMANALFELVSNQPDEGLYNLPLAEFQKALERKWESLKQARQTVLDYLRRPGMLFPRDQIRPIGACTKLEAWLLRRSVNIPLDLLEEISHAAPARASLPFMVFHEPRTSYALKRIKVYWLEDGLYALLFDNAAGKDDRWEKSRLQLTIAAPYLLVCDGVLRDSTCWEALAEVVGADGAHKPVVIILAAGVDHEVVFNDTFYTMVLPAPDGGLPMPERRQPTLEQIAHAFGTEVVSLPEAQGKLSPAQWRTAVQSLGRCRAVQIDRQRAILVPNEHLDARPGPSHRRLDGPAPRRCARPRAAWQVRSLDALILPPQDKADDIASVAKGEALLRMRVEAEDGIIAGAGAGLYWLAEHLDAPQDSPMGWLKEALRAPMLRILCNNGVAQETNRQLFEEVTNWVSGGERPWRTFLIERQEQTGARPSAGRKDMSRRIDAHSVLVMGEVGEVGVFTAGAQIPRMIDRAFQMAWHLASLNYLKHMQ